VESHDVPTCASSRQVSGGHGRLPPLPTLNGASQPPVILSSSREASDVCQENAIDADRQNLGPRRRLQRWPEFRETTQHRVNS
jgi:hypothetical protein